MKDPWCYIRGEEEDQEGGGALRYLSLMKTTHFYVLYLLFKFKYEQYKLNGPILFNFPSL